MAKAKSKARKAQNKASKAKGKASKTKGKARKGVARAKPRKSASKAKKGAAKAKKAAASSRHSAKAPSRAGKAARAAAQARTEKARKAVSRRPATPAVAVSRRPLGLDRERRTVRDEAPFPGPPSSLDLDRSASAARSGRFEYEEKLREHTSTGPALTGGDIDADWEDAESVGDEAPGGDNPTPDQDIVEEIGQAMGITYEDNEELKGGEELAERDRHRWELDPASREDEEE